MMLGFLISRRYELAVICFMSLGAMSAAGVTPPIHDGQIERTEEPTPLPESMEQACGAVWSDPRGFSANTAQNLRKTLEQWEKKHARSPHLTARLWIGRMALLEHNPDRITDAVDPILAGVFDSDQLSTQVTEALWLRGWSALLKAQPRLSPRGIPPTSGLTRGSEDLPWTFLGVPVNRQVTDPLPLNGLNAQTHPMRYQHARRAATSFEMLVLEADPQHRSRALEGMACALVLLGKHEQAVDLLGRALSYIQLDPNPSNAWDRQVMIRRLQLAQRQARALADLVTYGQAFAVFREADRLRLKSQDPAAALALYRRCITLAESESDQSQGNEANPAAHVADSVLAGAARLRECYCLIELEQPGPAQQRLNTLVETDPNSLFVGEAHLILSEMAINPRAGKVSTRQAIQSLDALDAWMKIARQDHLRATVQHLPSQILKSAMRLEAGSQRQQRALIGARLRSQAVEPGVILHHRNTLWYLDELEARAAMLRGFLLLAKGDGQAALIQFRRLLKLNPANQDNLLFRGPSDFARLKQACQKGYLVATPKELAPFRGVQRLGVLYGDFLYATRRFDAAEQIYQDLNEQRYGALSRSSRDYTAYGLAMCHARRGDKNKAVKALESVLAKRDRTATEQRATLALANLLQDHPDKDQRDRAKDLLQRLAYSKATSRWAHQARIMLALDDYASGGKTTAKKLLQRIRPQAGPLYRLARQLLITNNQR